MKLLPCFCLGFGAGCLLMGAASLGARDTTWGVAEIVLGIFNIWTAIAALNRVEE